MVSYNLKDWFKLVVQFHKSDTFRLLFFSLLSIAIYLAAIVYIELFYFHINSKNSTVMHFIFEFVLSLLLVFRTNTAYDRLCEGRKLWVTMVNNSRNLSLKLSVLLTHKSDKEDLKILITNYVYAVKNQLRNQYIQSEFSETKTFKLSELADAIHNPNIIAKHQYKKNYTLHQNKDLTPEHLFTLNEEVKSLTDNCGACERAQQTSIPNSYSIFLKKMIFLYCLTLPIFFANGFGYLSIVITVIVLYVFASIELIAEEIEDPFGEDDNDLPLDDICKQIKNNLTEIFK